jgi:UPF0755 protein
MPSKKKGKKTSRFFVKLLWALAIIIVAVGWYGLRQVYSPNVTIVNAKTSYFYIPTGSTINDVINSLYEQGFIKNRNTLEWIAELKNYKNHVYPGRYLLENNMSNNELIDLLRSGQQTPVKVTFHTVRTKAELAGIVGKKIETDSATIAQLLHSKEVARQYGFNTHSLLTMFIPNTYQFNWNTSAEEFLQRMAKEYKAFWTEERKSKARKLGLSQSEVAILASIVQAEQTMRKDERPRVAGLYLNRLRKKMRLESDPTIIYALNNFNIQRVLNVDRNVDSPYNTYRNRGLPPGPINLPEISSIDAVLNAEQHDFIFMCAKEDFSGYHNFAKTYAQHQVYAQRYRRELNRRRIYR